MADLIQTDEFAPETFRRLWGVQIVDYVVGGVKSDFESLVVKYAMKRATTVEGEVTPLSDIVQKRNAKLSKLGTALSDLSKAQSELSPEGKKPDDSATVSKDVYDVLNELTNGIDNPIKKETSGDQTTYSVTKANCEKAIQMIKTAMDKLNNESSRDMSRLQSLVDKRDESYSNASSLMQSISGCRDTAIRNMA